MTFTPILKEKVWGGDALRRWGAAVDAGARIGEAWLLADLTSTSPSGGGGDAAISEVADGPLRGDTIRSMLGAHGPEILGDAPATPEGAFPLLVKLLDAREDLSVQTHPSPAFAATHPDAHLKTETWFVLEASPGAAVYAGLAAGADPTALPDAAREGRLEPLLRRLPVSPGDCVHLPSGTLHALGAGVVVAEVQTPSDTTFRLYDWGRTGRQVHVAETMACLDADARPEPARAPADGAGRWTLVDTDAYRIDLLRLDPGATERIALHGRAWCAVCTGGAASVDSGAESCALRPGGFVLAPAHLGSVRLQAGDGGATALLVRVGGPSQAR